MKLVVLFVLLFSSLCLAEVSSTPVYSALETTNAEKSVKKPLGGSFAEGEKLLRAADPVQEANSVFETKGIKTILVCGFACLAPGEGVQKLSSTGELRIPATGDALNAQNKGYNEAAQDFARRFNEQMVVRASSPSTASAKPAEKISKALADADLTIGGVTIGKSNLYNSIGRFGPNAFHKEGEGHDAVSLVCWKGTDGTTLAFESDQNGGPDQVITEGRLLASGVEYKYSKHCKESKKVSSALGVAGLHLGDSFEIAEKKHGLSSIHEEERRVWHYAFEQKKKTIISDVELGAKESQINEIAVSKEITR